jgi:hypothetical protein
MRNTGQRTLNLRVRGSSPWRRTHSDLGLYPFRVPSCRLFPAHVGSTFARQSGPSPTGRPSRPRTRPFRPAPSVLSRPQRPLQSGPTDGYTERDIDRIAQLEGRPGAGRRTTGVSLTRSRAWPSPLDLQQAEGSGGQQGSVWDAVLALAEQSPVGAAASRPPAARPRHPGRRDRRGPGSSRPRAGRAGPRPAGWSSAGHGRAAGGSRTGGSPPPAGPRRSPARTALPAAAHRPAAHTPGRRPRIAARPPTSPRRSSSAAAESPP